MKPGNQGRIRTALAAVLFLLCMTAPGFGEPGSPRRGGRSHNVGGGTHVRLSLQIARAKKKNRQVSFYKSVARQMNVRSTGDRSPSSGR